MILDGEDILDLVARALEAAKAEMPSWLDPRLAQFADAPPETVAAAQPAPHSGDAVPPAEAAPDAPVPAAPVESALAPDAMRSVTTDAPPTADAAPADRGDLPAHDGAGRRDMARTP